MVPRRGIWVALRRLYWRLRLGPRPDTSPPLGWRFSCWTCGLPTQTEEAHLGHRCDERAANLLGPWRKRVQEWDMKCGDLS